MNKPIRTLSVFCLLLFLALMVNATYLQYWRADSLDHDSRNQRAVDAAFSQQRGAIFVGRQAVAQSVKSHDRYVYQRTYSRPFLYSQITGWYNYYNAQSGSCTSCQQRIEQTENTILTGDDDSLFVDRLVDLLSNKPSQGGNIELTINPAAQRAAYDGLSKVLGPDGQGAVVALQPSTGKVLAMVSLPSFDPNELASHDLSKVNRAANRLEADPDQPLLNRAIQTRLPPGSTFKLVVASAAIENGLYTKDSQVPGGSSFQLPQTTGESGLITNEIPNCGTTTIPFAQALENSCNTSFVQIGLKVGADKLKEQAEKFGFGQQYFTDLLPQVASVFPDDANRPQTGQSSIGQFDVAATPLQMAMVAAGIANDGKVMRPYLVDSVQSPEFEQIESREPEELSQAISSSTAKQVTDLMIDTVDFGTAKPAAIPGIQVAGKTGTANSSPERPPYAWFVSFAPADENPQVAVAVMIQKAPNIERGDIAGGLLGGPIAKAIMEAVINK